MKRSREIFMTVLFIVYAIKYLTYSPRRFWSDFTGMTEAQVRQRLREPFRDTRDLGGRENKTIRLGWYQGFGVGLFREFKDDVVVSQQRSSRCECANTVPQSTS